MRKLIAPAALLGLLAFAAMALATNTYTVSSTVSPSKPGSKKHPVTVALNFNFTVGDTAGNRPSEIDKYTIGFAGIRTNGGGFPKCTAAKLNSTQSDASCPKGSLVGSGSVENLAGPTSDPTPGPGKQLPCHLDLKIYNGGQGRAALFLKGNPQAAKPCPISISQALDGRYVAGPKGGSALTFAVSGALLHPLTGLDNSVVRVAASIQRRTGKKGKHKVGYFEAIGGCSAKKRAISATFHTAAGQSTTVSTGATCQ